MIYLVNLSKGDPIRIDDDDLQKIEENIDERLIRVKQGIINPSFMISIVPTGEPETKVKPIIERRGDKMVKTSESEMKVLGDLMNPKRLIDNK